MEIYADISYRYFRKRYDKKGENGMEIPNNYFHNEKKIDSIADLKAIGKSIIKLFEEAGDNTEEKKKNSGREIKTLQIKGRSTRSNGSRNWHHIR